MKNLILGLGRFFVDLGSFIQLLIVIALSITVGVAAGGSLYNDGLGFLVGILTFLALFTIFILSNYLFYLILGMHDSQVSMARSLEIMSGRKNLSDKQISQVTSIYNTERDTKKCLVCGTQYKDGELFCGECGNKLN